MRKIKNIFYIAPTHKARGIMTQYLGNEASTMTVQSFILLKEEEYLEFNLIIIDEITMIEDENWRELFKILINMSKKFDKIGFKCFFVGDPNQIHPFQSIGFYKRVIESCKIKNILKLKKQWRRKEYPKVETFINYFLKNSSFEIDTDFIKSFSLL